MNRLMQRRQLGAVVTLYEYLVKDLRTGEIKPWVSPLTPAAFDGSLSVWLGRDVPRWGEIVSYKPVGSQTVVNPGTSPPAPPPLSLPNPWDLPPALPPPRSVPVPVTTFPSLPRSTGTTARANDVIGTRAVTLGKGGETRTSKSFLEIGDLVAAGWLVLRDDGSPMRVELFGPAGAQGELFDGHPINVLLGLGWLPGQQTALAPAVNSGAIPEPTIDLTKVYRPGSSTTLAIAGAAIVGGLWVFSRSQRRKG